MTKQEAIRKEKDIDIKITYDTYKEIYDNLPFKELGIIVEALEKQIVKTNADRIRNMSDKELSEWLTKITDDAQLDAKTKCNYRWHEWLQKEVE